MQNNLIARFEREWRFARGLTRDLLRSLGERELTYSPGMGMGPLWKHFRHLGRVQENYLHTLDTRRIAFGFDGVTYTGGASQKDLLAYLERVDTLQRKMLTALNPKTVITWDDKTVDAYDHLMRMVQHETLHHGMFVVSMRLLGKPCPPSWSAWGV